VQSVILPPSWLPSARLRVVLGLGHLVQCLGEHLASDDLVAVDGVAVMALTQCLGELALGLRSTGCAAGARRPHHNPRAITDELEERIVRLRKTLAKACLLFNRRRWPNFGPS